MQELTVKGMCLAACVMSCAAAMSMPSRSELKNVQGLVNELMASDIQAMKAGKLKPSQVAASAERLAGDAQGEAAKFLLYKGAFGLYVQGGSYDEAIGAIGHLKAAVKDVPDKVVAEILREKLKRIPKKNGSAIFNLYDGLCRRMAATEERGKLEKQLKASPADRQTRRALAVRCVQMGDWKAAREHFLELRGKEAAAVKAEEGDIAEAADFWWGYQPEVDGADGEPFREYAVSLYRKAIDEGKLAGLKLVLAKKRVAEAGGGAGEATQKVEPKAEEAPAKVEVAEKKPLGAEPKPAAHGGGGRVDWSLPKNFKGARYLDFDIGDGEALPFIAISAGSSRYGNSRMPKLQHEICIARPFWITRIPVTSRQFRLSGIDVHLGGDIFEEKFANDKDAIILACTTIEYAEQYAKWLNEKFGSSLPKGWVFRLPTQGEVLQLSYGNLRRGYKSYTRNFGKDRQWLNAVQAKGLFTDCKTFNEVVSLCPRYRFMAFALEVDVSDLKKEKHFVWYIGVRTHCLDRISIDFEGVDQNVKNDEIIKDPKLLAQFVKALNYRPKETDPFRYADDNAPGTMFFAGGEHWFPYHQMPNLFHIVVGPDYVGEWKAKNGK